MAKRGEKQPWKVRYEWANGIRGTIAFSTESNANLKAAEIQRASEWRGVAVSVTVVEVV